MKLNRVFISILIYFTFFTSGSTANENRILIKVNNEIITSIDILNEIKYFSIINNQFKETKKKTQIQIVKNSLIKEKIKKIELLKFSKNLEINDKLLENIIIKYFSNFNIGSISDFEYFLEQKNINSNFIKKKITIETLWNQLIYKKFYKNVKIDKDEIKKDISRKGKQKEYLLSELLINVENNNDFKEKVDLIKNTLKNKSFSETALIHSISETAARGGELGWVNENALNNKIKDELKDVNIGMITKPIVVPGGFLILKIKDINEVEKKINIDNEIKFIIDKKTNEQLNRFSIIYFNKVKKNILINDI
tara:strand:- start:529 stop:1455 length:927 start_codon:yes stop_codon:yes gene_type:complete